MNKTRNPNEYDILKAFAIILVVVGHITILFKPDAYPNEDVRLPGFITFGIYLFHMPLYMAISGAVYQLSRSKAKYQKFVPFVINKLRRIIVPYYLVGLLVLLPVMVYTNQDLCREGVTTFNKILLATDCRHLWYLLALFWIFILQFSADKLQTNLYVLFAIASVLTLVVSWCLPTFHFMCFEMALRYWPCFILGIIMVKNVDKYPIRRSVLASIAGVGLCAAMITVSANYYVDMIFSLALPYFICVALIVVARNLTLSEKWQWIIREITGYNLLDELN